MEDLIINFAKTGKFEFKGFMNSILEELLRSQVRSLMAQIFNLSGKSATNAGGLLGGSIIPGFLAQGGNAMAGMPYVVGENGPEMFVPNQSGTVIPNNQMAAASTYVTYNINAVDAMSFKQMVAADPSFIYAVSQQGAKSIPQTRR
jgi:phage-related minor tail protein